MDYDRGSGPYRGGKPVRPSDLHQEVLNESWPQRDKNGSHARNVPHQPVEKHVDVIVRLDFATDGEAFVDGRATRWTRSHVFVELNDPRLAQMFIWVLATDVRRR